MIQRAFWVPALLVLGLALAGLIGLRGELLALALPLATYLVVAYLRAPQTFELEAERRLSTDRITEGMPVSATVAVHNAGGTIEELFLHDLVPPPAEIVEPGPARLARLEAGEPLSWTYRLQGRRGRYRFEGLAAAGLDPFGLFAQQGVVAARSDLLMYPRISELPALPIRPPQTKGFTGPIPSRRRGTGMDFLGVREYQLGDSLRHINWKASARHSVDLFANEYEQERVADVGLILDARPHVDIAVNGRRLFDYSVEATAGLAQAFLEAGHCVSLLVYGAGIARVFPGYGKQQRERILRVLAAADTGINYALEALRHLPVRMLPARCQVVYVGPLIPGDLEPLVGLRAQGYSVLVVSPDPLYAERLLTPDGGRADVAQAERLARVERAVLINGLRRAGVQVIHWRVDEPLAGILEQAGYGLLAASRRAHGVGR